MSLSDGVLVLVVLCALALATTLKDSFDEANPYGQHQQEVLGDRVLDNTQTMHSDDANLGQKILAYLDTIFGSYFMR